MIEHASRPRDRARLRPLVAVSRGAGWPSRAAPRRAGACPGSAVVATCAIAIAALLACVAEPSDPAGVAGVPAPRAASGRAEDAFPFTNVTSSSGIDFVHDNGADGRRHYVETMGPGVCLFDADMDGDLDIYAVDGGPLPGSPPRDRPPNRLFLNRGDGTFEDGTADSGAGDTGYGMGCLVGDEDGDGDPDLYVLNYGANALLRNRGDGTFERVAKGVEDPSWSVSGAFLDYDGDLDLDLWVVNYLRYSVDEEHACRAGTLAIYCSPEQYPPQSDRLLRNDGGRYTDVTAEAGVLADGRGMGIGTSDLDLDGDLDVYVANDRSPNHLYLDEGDRLHEVGAELGVAYSPMGMAEGGMGVVTGDLLGDGRSAIFVTNFQKEPNRLLVRSEGLFFADQSSASRLGPPSTELVGWGIGLGDFEGDGDLDLAVANGHVFDNAEEFIPGSAFALPDHLYLNQGNGTFALESFPPPHYSSRGVAAGDLDGDGDLDLVVGTCGDRLQVWRNDVGAPDRFVLVRLHGRAPNTDAYGARVVATIGERTTWREVTSGGSYASQSDTRLHFGLAAAAQIDELQIRWPDGSSESVGPLGAGRTFVVRQGEGVVEREPLRGEPES